LHSIKSGREFDDDEFRAFKRSDGCLQTRFTSTPKRRRKYVQLQVPLEDEERVYNFMFMFMYRSACRNDLYLHRTYTCV